MMKLGRVKVSALELRSGARLDGGDWVPGSEDRLPRGSVFLYCVEGEGALYMNVGTTDNPDWRRLAQTWNT